MKHEIAGELEQRLVESLDRLEVQFEENIGWRPVKVAAWGVATASVLGAVTAGFGAVAAGAGAVIAVRAALRVREESKQGRFQEASSVSMPIGSQGSAPQAQGEPEAQSVAT